MFVANRANGSRCARVKPIITGGTDQKGDGMKSFIGRPEGIGNRLEELFILNALIQTGKIANVTYVWNRARPGVKHWSPSALSSPVELIESDHGLPHVPINTWMERLGLTPPSCDEIRASARMFHVNKSADTDVILVIRATDRISWRRSLSQPDHFMSRKESTLILERARDFIAELDTPRVGLVGESRKLLVENGLLLQRDTLVSAVVQPMDPWCHLASISSARVIVLAAKFSSFPLVGLLMGGEKGRLYVPVEASEQLLRSKCVDNFYTF